MKHHAKEIVRIAIVQVGAIELAVHLLRVVEIISARELLKTGSSDTVLGLLAIRGQLLPVFDMHQIFSKASGTSSVLPSEKMSGQFVLVVACGRELVLAVDRLREVFDAPLESLVPNPITKRGDASALLCGAILFEKREIALLDLVSLAERHDVADAADPILAARGDKP